jgi:hypothetical protein
MVNNIQDYLKRKSEIIQAEKNTSPEIFLVNYFSEKVFLNPKNISYSKSKIFISGMNFYDKLYITKNKIMFLEECKKENILIIDIVLL